MSRVVVVWLVVLLASTRVWGQEASQEAVRFQYEAPDSCPDAASFTARVRERTQRGRMAGPGELARAFSVSISTQASGFSGTVEFVDDSGERVSRSVRGAQCDDVVSSIALITALALDASLRDDPAPPPAPASSATPMAIPLRGSSPPPLPLSPRQPRRPSSFLGAGLGVEAGYTSLEAPTIGLMGDLTWRSGLTLRLLAHFSSADRNVDADRSANVRLIGAESSLCPARARLGRFLLYPCVGLDLGALTARGLGDGNLPSFSSSTVFWPALGLRTRLAWEPETTPLWLELSAGIGFPLVRHQFVFKLPEATVLEIPPVTGAVGLASGVHFW